MPVDPFDPGERVLLVERSDEFVDSGWFPLELGLNRAIQPVAHKAPDAERTGKVSYELPEVHSLHPADEPEPYPRESHALTPLGP